MMFFDRDIIVPYIITQILFKQKHVTINKLLSEYKLKLEDTQI